MIKKNLQRLDLIFKNDLDTEIILSKIFSRSNDDKYIICNADEGEPGTFKDREILYCN